MEVATEVAEMEAAGWVKVATEVVEVATEVVE